MKYEIKIVNREHPDNFIKLSPIYKSLEGAKVRRDYEQFKYGSKYFVEIWEITK